MQASSVVAAWRVSFDKLKQAIESFSEVYESESDVYLTPLSINELHEFLTLV